MQICVNKLTIIISDNCLSPGQRKGIIWTNTKILSIQTLGTNFSEILSKIHTFSLKKMHFKMLSGKCRPFCLGLNVLRQCGCIETAPWWNHLSVIPDPKNLKLKFQFSPPLYVQSPPEGYWEFRRLVSASRQLFAELTHPSASTFLKKRDESIKLLTSNNGWMIHPFIWGAFCCWNISTMFVLRKNFNYLRRVSIEKW